MFCVWNTLRSSGLVRGRGRFPGGGHVRGGLQGGVDRLGPSTRKGPVAVGAGTGLEGSPVPKPKGSSPRAQVCLATSRGSVSVDGVLRRVGPGPVLRAGRLVWARLRGCPLSRSGRAGGLCLVRGEDEGMTSRCPEAGTSARVRAAGALAPRPAWREGRCSTDAPRREPGPGASTPCWWWVMCSRPGHRGGLVGISSQMFRGHRDQIQEEGGQRPL